MELGLLIAWWLGSNRIRKLPGLLWAQKFRNTAITSAPCCLVIASHNLSPDSSRIETSAVSWRDTHTLMRGESAWVEGYSQLVKLTTQPPWNAYGDSQLLQSERRKSWWGGLGLKYKRKLTSQPAWASLLCQGHGLSAKEKDPEIPDKSISVKTLEKTASQNFHQLVGLTKWPTPLSKASQSIYKDAEASAWQENKYYHHSTVHFPCKLPEKITRSSHNMAVPVLGLLGEDKV